MALFYTVYFILFSWCKKWHFFTPNSRLSQCTTVLQSMLRKHPRGGTQDATCGAPERMSPAYRRGHVDCQRPLAQVTFSPMREVMIWSTSSIVLE